MTKEILGRDVNGAVDFSLPPPEYCYDAVLAQDTLVTVAIPPYYNRVFFSYAVGTNVWVTMDGTSATVPGSSGASTQELNPGQRQINLQCVRGGNVIKLISDTASHVNMRFDQGQGPG